MEHQELLKILQQRFQDHPQRHPHVDWKNVYSKIETSLAKLHSLQFMEDSGGEPDVVEFENIIYFIDCSSESPKERRSFCYDNEALEKRKEHKPKNSAIGLATTMGVEILTPADYKKLQQIEAFDQKTSSWLLTPENIRNKGGAIFGNRRYDEVFIYHNGAESYYASRGFRTKLKI